MLFLLERLPERLGNIFYAKILKNELKVFSIVKVLRISFLNFLPIAKKKLSKTHIFFQLKLKEKPIKKLNFSGKTLVSFSFQLNDIGIFPYFCSNPWSQQHFIKFWWMQNIQQSIRGGFMFSWFSQELQIKPFSKEDWIFLNAIKL